MKIYPTYQEMIKHAIVKLRDAPWYLRPIIRFKGTYLTFIEKTDNGIGLLHGYVYREKIYTPDFPKLNLTI